MEENGGSISNDEMDLNAASRLKNTEDNEFQTFFGPLSKEDAEKLQIEANEETTKSEDLRLFLQEMRQHVSQQQQQPQQQVGSTSQMFGSVYDQLRGGNPLPRHAQQALTTRGSGVGPTTTHKRSVTGDQDYVLESAPDGGWGWIVVFSSFVCMVLVDGISLCYGLLVAPTCPGNTLKALEKDHPRPETATSLGIVWSTKAREVPVRVGSCVGISEMGEALGTQSRSALMLPGGLLVGIYLLLGPLASALSNQFDFRPVAMAGGVVATIGLAGAAFSTNVPTLHGTLGVVVGIGFGLIYLPAIATVGHWFKRRRPFAVGVALCGSGVGTIIGGQVLPLLVDWFAWSGTLILLAAFCAQCLVLIMLFRPLDLHLRMRHQQHLHKQAAKDYERQQNAYARVLEHRARRRCAGALKAETGTAAVVVTAAAASTATGNHTRTKGHTSVAIAAAARAQATQARAAKKALKAQQQQQRRIIYRGSIMQQIIEEKRRQRTVSLGSLDGMVITRDNELIAAPLVADRPPLLTAASILRISEAVMRKMDARLAGWHDGGGGGGGVVPTDVSTPPVRCNSNCSQTPLDILNTDSRPVSLSRKSSGMTSHTGLSRLNLVRESLPQLIQDYVQSQASIAFHNYLVRQRQHASHPIDSPCGTGATGPISAHVAGTETIASISPQSRKRSMSNTATLCSTGGDATTLHTQRARMLSSLLQSRDLTIYNTPTVQPPQEVEPIPPCMNGDPRLLGIIQQPPPPSPSQNLFVPSACASECISLRRTISDGSLVSSNRGLSAHVPLEIQQEVAELLDGEVRAEVQQRLRRELMRPQYKKDLFFAGSTQQLDHTPVSAIPLCETTNMWVKQGNSTWDIGPSNNPGTPIIVQSNRAFNVDCDAHVEAKSISSLTSVSLQQKHLSNGTNSITAAAVAGQPVSSSGVVSGSGRAGDTANQSLHVDVDYGMDDISISPQPHESVPKRPSCCSSPILNFLEELLAPGLLLSPTFIFLLLSNLFTIWGLIIPYFMFPDMVAEKNWTPRTAGSLISYVGFANTIGRCIATLYIEKAWSSHYKWADCLRVNVGSLLIASCACAVVPLVGHSHNLMICAGSVFGLFSAVVVSLKSILVVELFGLDKLTNAFGHMLILQGLSSIGGTLIGGHLFDIFVSRAPAFVPWAGSTAPLVHAADASFYFAGGSFLLAALFASPLRTLAAREVICATYSTAAPGLIVGGGGGRIYLDDYFDCVEGAGFLDDSTAPLAEAPMTTSSVANLIQASVQAVPTIANGVASQAFNAAVPSYMGEGSVSMGGPIAGETLDLPPPVETVQSPPPAFLSPAPLPSSLFIATDVEAQVQQSSDVLDIEAGGGIIDNRVEHLGPGQEEEEAGVITTAGVPMGIPPTRSVVSAVQELPITWTPPPASTMLAPPTEAKTTLVAEEPSLEPVKEEEEEDMEDPGQHEVEGTRSATSNLGVPS